MRWRTWLLPLAIIILFWWTRLYRLPQTLEVFSDMGRDLSVLTLWKQTGKLPLLGPGVSFFQMNQSPLYYYLYFPVFVLSHWSPYTTVLTLIMVFTILYGAGWLLVRKDILLRRVYLIVGFLVVVHPELLIQTRYPWNPSFTLPCLIASVMALLVSGKRPSRWHVILMAVSLAAALGFSYSVLPTVLILGLLAFVQFRSKLKLFVGSLIVSGVVIFAPVLFSLLRHGGIRHLFAASSSGALAPLGRDIVVLLQYLFGGASLTNPLVWMVGVLFLFSAILAIRFHESRLDRLHAGFIVLFLLSCLLTALPVFAIEEHYIFGPLVLFLFVIATMRRWILIPTLLLLFFLWEPFLFIRLQKVEARRPVASLEQCAALVCSFEHEPVYVSEQAWHLYHNALDFNYFFNRAGCNARDITTNPGFAETMLLVADNSTYTPGKTAFNELTLFGTAKMKGMYQCQSHVSVYVLRHE